MHGLAVQLAPVIAAKSKVPFYVAGGALVLWALILALALGLRKPEFPGNLRGERVVIAITSVLVLAALATAVLTSGPEKAEVASARSSAAPQPSGSTSAPAPAPPAPGTASAATPAPPAPAGATTTAAKPAAPAPAPAPAPAAETKLALAANPAGLLSYNTKQLSAKAGKVTITLTNSSPVEHNVTIMLGTKVVGGTPTFVGGSKSLSLTLQPGSYVFYCSVPGHRQAGMEGTLKVS